MKEERLKEIIVNAIYSSITESKGNIEDIVCNHPEVKTILSACLSEKEGESPLVIRGTVDGIKWSKCLRCVSVVYSNNNKCVWCGTSLTWPTEGDKG